MDTPTTTQVLARLHALEGEARWRRRREIILGAICAALVTVAATTSLGREETLRARNLTLQDSAGRPRIVLDIVDTIVTTGHGQAASLQEPCPRLRFLDTRGQEQLVLELDPTNEASIRIGTESGGPSIRLAASQSASTLNMFTPAHTVALATSVGGTELRLGDSSGPSSYLVQEGGARPALRMYDGRAPFVTLGAQTPRGPSEPVLQLFGEGGTLRARLP